MSETKIDPPAQQQHPIFNVVGGPPIMDVFSNQLRMGVTLSDFTLIFGVTESGPTGIGINREKVAIHLAPVMLKQLLLNIEVAVTAYEEAVAPISIQANAREKLTEIKKALVSQLQAAMAGV